MSSISIFCKIINPNLAENIIIESVGDKIFEIRNLKIACLSYLDVAINKLFNDNFPEIVFISTDLFNLLVISKRTMFKEALKENIRIYFN
jgi:hypothetical protein